MLDPDGSGIPSFHIRSDASPTLASIREEKREAERMIRELPDGEERAALIVSRTELSAREQAEEDAVRAQLSNELAPWKQTLLDNTDAIGRLDLTIQKANLSNDYDVCFPEIASGCIRFSDMSNPHVAALLKETGKCFTPLSMELKPGATVLTGANMGGKSVALRTLALNVMLIHYGFFPFSKEASCPLLSSINLLSDDLSASDRNLSSFGSEIVGLLEVLGEIENGESLLLLDEFASGTNPAEGAAIARGVCDYLNGKSAFTVMSTHYEGVAARARAHYQVARLRRLGTGALGGAEIAGKSMAERVAMIADHMDYGISRVSTEECPPTDAINICRMLGLPEDVMNLIDRNGGINESTTKAENEYA